MFPRILSSGLVWLVSCSLFVQPISAAEAPPPADLPELKAAIAMILEEHGVPAVGIAMVNEDGPVWIGALGKSNLETDVEADERTLFRIGSTSKMFVALAVLKLVEEGRLSLDDTLAEWAPEIAFENPWEDSDPVRIVHLLEHTTGWDDIHLPEYAHNDPTPITLKQGLDFHPHSRVSRWKPGSRFSYCNAGPPAAAYVVEKVTGQGFEEYVNDNFFKPMGMETMSYRQTPEVLKRGATLYTGGTKPEDYWHIIMRPAGSINASSRDMARFLDFFLQRGRADGRQLISETSLTRMETAVSTGGALAGQQIGYGLHNYSSGHGQWVYREHNGGVNGGLTEFAYLPEAGVGHAIMINSDSGAGLLAISELIRDFETRNLPTITFEKEREVSARNREIEGYYHPINSRQEISYFLDRLFSVQKLWFAGDRLARKALLADDVTYYYPVSEELYKSEETGRISLVRTTDPLAGEVIHSGLSTLVPISGFLVFLSLGLSALWGLMIVSSLVFFLVWIVRLLRGNIQGGATIRVRLWPLLASVSVIGFVALFAYGYGDPFRLLGQVTWVSLGIMTLSLTFAIFAFLGAYTSFRERKTPMNRIAYWHSTLSSLVHTIAAVYFLYFGVIGVMVWA
jgi:CubicO group peptidase (beta-lactamase class C family)